MVTLNDSEQLDLLKEWWKRHGKTVVMAIALIFVGAIAWQTIQWYQAKQAEKASIIYEQMFLAATEKNVVAATGFAEEIVKSYKHTSYADLAHLWLAQQAVQKNNFENAYAHLQWVRERASDQSLRQIAAIRLARLLMQQKQYQKALALLDKPLSKTYAPIIDETRGDIYRVQDQKQKAREAYLTALQFAQNDQNMRMRLQIKLSDVGGAQ